MIDPSRVKIRIDGGSRRRGREWLCHLANAVDEVRDELGAALDSEVTVEGRHVLMHGSVTQAESRRHLLLAVALEQARERLL